MGLFSDGNSALSNLRDDADAGLIDFFVHLGDHAYDMGHDDDRRGDGYMNAIQTVAARLPWVPLMGNHEWTATEGWHRFLNQTFGLQLQPGARAAGPTQCGHERGCAPSDESVARRHPTLSTNDPTYFFSPLASAWPAKHHGGFPHQLCVTKLARTCWTQTFYDHPLQNLMEVRLRKTHCHRTDTEIGAANAVKSKTDDMPDALAVTARATDATPTKPRSSLKFLSFYNDCPWGETGTTTGRDDDESPGERAPSSTEWTSLPLIAGNCVKPGAAPAGLRNNGCWLDRLATTQAHNSSAMLNIESSGPVFCGRLGCEHCKYICPDDCSSNATGWPTAIRQMYATGTRGPGAGHCGLVRILDYCSPV